MNSGEQKNSENQTKTSYGKKPYNKTAIWLILMFWPPVALLALAILSVLVNFLAAPPSSPPLPTSTSAALTAQTFNNPPAGLETLNFLIFIGVVLAIVAAILNFTAGVVIFMKKAANGEKLIERFL